MENEKILMESRNGLIRLTNYKIRYVSKSFGRARIVSIMLNEVSAIEVHFKSFVPALVVGMLFLLGAIIQRVQVPSGPSGIGFFIVGGLFVAYYLLSRKHVVSIASSGKRSIDFHSRGLDTDAILKFVNKVEEAKLVYEKSLQNKSE